MEPLTLTCRCCSSKEATGYIEFETVLNDLTFLERFNYCTRLQASSNDGLPNFICVPCCKLLQTTYNFIKLASETDNMLRAINFKNLEGQILEIVIKDDFLEYENSNSQPTMFESVEILEKEITQENMVGSTVHGEGENNYHEPTVTSEFISMNTEPESKNPEQVICTDKELILWTWTAKEKLQSNASQGKTRHPCTSCGKVYPKCSSQQCYEKTEHLKNKKRAQCPYCKGLFINIKTHMRMNHSDILASPDEETQNISLAICPYCQKNCRTISMLNDHVNTHTGDRPYTCDICHETFEQKLNLDLHKYKNHQIQKESSKIECNQEESSKFPEVLKCTLCNFTTKSKSSLSRHKNRHNRPTEPKYLCAFCSRKFWTPKELANHEDFQHGNKERALKCDLCDKIFPHANSLRSHKQCVHSDINPLRCGECLKIFKNEFRLKRHKRMHSKDISCPQCDKKFAEKVDLKVHMRTHTGDLPYECKICDKRYASKSAHTYHMQRHKGIRHKCQHCSEEFDIRSQFRLHMFKHLGMPYTCDHCEEGFVKRISLARHSKRIHKIILTEDDLSVNRTKNQQNVNRLLVSKSILVSSKG